MEQKDNSTQKKYHFITGLPRSGSTLLTSILNQNPRFHSSITDPLALLVKGVIEVSQNGPGFKSEVPESRRINLIQGVVDAYYKDTDKEVIFNTNRGWSVMSHLIKKIYPQSKMIITVRDINWVLDSFELAHRRNPLAVNTATGGLSSTVYSRVDDLMKESGIVGFPYIGIKQAITSNETDMMMLIEYDDLCKNPLETMQKLYNFIGEPYYDHDFNNVEASWDEYDSEIGTKLHDVKRKIQYQPRKSVLPPDIQAKFRNLEVWRNLK